MADISVVAVTGASGFVGAHIVRECLERGYHVNACVRNKNDSKVQFLPDMAKNIGKGKLQLFSADLMKKGAYDDAVSNADAVIHAACQVHPEKLKDTKEMVEPSIEGVRNILSSVNKFSNVKHFVHTSAVAAMITPKGVMEDSLSGHTYSEKDWSTVKAPKSKEEDPYMQYAYIVAKTEGEKIMWSETSGKPYTVSAIHPSMNFGPCLAKHHTKASPYIFRQALLGHKPMNQEFTMVDVRDTATAHVEAMIRPEANGKRFILTNTDPNIAVNDVIQKSREKFSQYVFDDLLDEAPNPPKQPGHMTTAYDNSLSKTVLGLKYTPQEKTIQDSVDSMVKGGFVPLRSSSKL